MEELQPSQLANAGVAEPDRRAIEQIGTIAVERLEALVDRVVPADERVARGGAAIARSDGVHRGCGTGAG
ncbi:hypothetical protein [Rubidibacter lacunae]|uniref:hypothetical protein n=1 Tax=Rubidibacter lacunae TaxID=582514 RepID=UPI000408CDD5|nr:hypothetical protein [Rubidibacter lacunae]